MKDRCVYVKQSDCWISFPFPAARLAYGSVNYKIPIIKSKASKARIEITVYHEFVRSIDRSIACPFVIPFPCRSNQLISQRMPPYHRLPTNYAESRHPHSDQATT